MRIKTVLIAIVVIALSFVAGLKIMDWWSPRGAAPRLVALPPLPDVARNSSILAPIRIPLKVIASAADRATPRDFNGKAANPVPQLLQNADIDWTARRGTITASGGQNALALATPLTGTLKVKGSLSESVQGALGNALGSLLGGNAAKQLGSLNIKNVNADAEIRGNVGMTARPALLANWRIEPNLAAKVDLGDTDLSVAGIRVNVPAQVKPALDNAVNEQLAGLQERIRNDPVIEQNARREWAKMCRSIPLQGAGASGPKLWLELRPTRAVAAQPRVDADALTLTLGIDGETRITSAATKPDCPFPAKLDIVPASAGRMRIGVPIDLPFTEINTLLDAQLAGKTFPEDGNGAVAVKVKRAMVAASGDRLLISLLIDAKENRSWFGLGTDASVHIWGRPILDQAQQVLRLTDISLSVESEAAYGLLNAATKAALPYLEKALADRAVIDLKPFAANARQRIAAEVRNFQKNDQGARVDADITSLRLSGIAFDSTKLRIIADAEGTAKVTVNRLPGL